MPSVRRERLALKHSKSKVGCFVLCGGVCVQMEALLYSVPPAAKRRRELVTVSSLMWQSVMGRTHLAHVVSLARSAGWNMTLLRRARE